MTFTHQKAVSFLGLTTLFGSTVHNHRFKGTQPDAAHWVGEFGSVPGAWVVKAHVYVLSRQHQVIRYRGTRSKQNDNLERLVLGDIIYQKEWKTGVKHIHGES